MGGENLLCVICCLSYKPSRRVKLEDEDDGGIVEIVSKFCEEILGEFKKPPPTKSPPETISLSTGDDDIKKSGRKRGKKKRKVLLEDFVGKVEAGEGEGGGASGKPTVNLGVEGRSNIKEILESCDSCEPDNMSICPDCVGSMKTVTDARAQSIQMEEKVRKLQLLLLKGLRILQGQMNEFYEEMDKLDESMSIADVPCLEARLSLVGSKKSKITKTLFGRTPVNQYTIRRERVLRLRRQIFDASKDLRKYRLEIQEKISVDANQQDSEDKVTNSLSIPEPTQDFQVPSVNVKEEISIDQSLDYEEEGECGFDFQMDVDEEAFSQVVEAEWSKLETLPEPPTQTFSRRRASSHNKKTEAKPISEDDLSDESSESDFNDDNDDDYNPLKLTKKGIRNGFADQIPITRTFSTYDFILKDLPKFRRSVVESVLKKRPKHLAQLKTDSKEEIPPIQRHMKELIYHPDQKAIILSGIAIRVLDKEENPEVENALECSKCSHRVTAEVEKMELAMYDHVISKHFQSYECPICEIKLDTNHEYLTHLKECRKSNESCICDICGKTLACKRSLEQHKWTHMNEEEKAEAVANGFKPIRQKKVTERNFACESCPKKFKFATELRTHQETHKSREEREQYVCPNCGKNFLKGGYEYHLQNSECGVALGERVPRPPMECHVCKAVIKSKIGMRQHMRLQHSNLDSSELYRFVCQLCGKAFKTNSNLKLHAFTHTGLKPFKCGKCGSSFTRDANLKRHAKTCGNVSGGDSNSFTVEGEQQRTPKNEAPENGGFYPYYQGS